MNILIKDKIGLSENDVIGLAISLLKNREPKDGSFDYGLETHGAIGISMSSTINKPIQVRQTNIRKNNNSPIHISIEEHVRIM